MSTRREKAARRPRVRTEYVVKVGHTAYDKYLDRDRAEAACAYWRSQGARARIVTRKIEDWG